MARALRGVVVVVLVAAGFAAGPARARAPVPRTRLAVLPAGKAPVRSPFPVSHIAVRWRGSEDVRVEVRAGRPGRLGPWRPVIVDDDQSEETPGTQYSGLLRADGATLVEVRAGEGATEVEVFLIDASRGATPSPTASTDGRFHAAEAGWSPPQPPVISRAAWGADEGLRKGAPEFAPLSKLFVHHTVTQNDDPDPASTVRAIYAYHTRGNGWNDIGYNFLVDASGRVYEGRYARSYEPGEVPTGEDRDGRGVVGAHAKVANVGSTGIALLGEYNGTVQPSPAAVDSLIRLLAWKAGRHGTDPEGASPYTGSDGAARTFPNIAGHRDVGSTACPGGRLYDRLPEIRHRVAETMRPPPAAPPPPPAPVPPPPPAVPPIPGFWTASGQGQVRAFGDAPAAGDLSGRPVNAPIVSLAATPSGRGYWLAGADGGVYAFGDAPFLGAATGRLSGPVAHIEPTPSGKGYWVLSGTGEVLAFGDASFVGSTALLPFKTVGMASTPSAEGYWIASADGRVFAFGDAVLAPAAGNRLPSGAAGAMEEAKPSPTIVAIAAHPDGRGYWLLGRDGGVFAFDVPFHGSVADRRPYDQAVNLRVTESGGGYYVAGADGAMFAFGDADRRRERPSHPEEGGVVDFALHRSGAPQAAGSAGPASPPAPPGPPPVPAPPGG